MFYFFFTYSYLIMKNMNDMYKDTKSIILYKLAGIRFLSEKFRCVQMEKVLSSHNWRVDMDQ